MGSRIYRFAFLLAVGSSLAWAAPREKLAEKTVSRIDARLFSQPNRYGNPVSIVGRGLELTVLRYSSSRSWAFVQTPSKRRGWIPVRVTTLGLRYSAGALTSSQPKQEVGRLPASVASPATRGPASDLDDLGYDGTQYEGDAQDLVDAASDEAGDEAQVAPPSEDTATEVPDVMSANGTDPSISALQSSGDADNTNSDIPDPQNAPIDPTFAGGGDDGGGDAPSVDTQALSQELDDVDGFVDSTPMATEPGDQRKKMRGVKISKASKDRTAPATPQLYLGTEYANQVNIGKASGFGFGLGGSYPINETLRLGLAVYWDHFGETAQTSVEQVHRRANVFRVGPVATFQQGPLGFDALVGWTQSATKISVTDLNGTLITSDYNDAFSDGAFGLRFTPHFDFDIDDRTAVRAYLAYSVDFFPLNGGNTGVPQTFAIGAAFVLGL